MQDRIYHKVTAIVLSVVILGVAVYGTYLPMRKAQIFIATLQSLQDPSTQATSLQDLESRLSIPLDYPSPIGQEELVRNLGNSVLGFIQQGADPTSTAELITFLNSYYDPILAQGKGMSFGQDLYLEGAVNETAFASTGDPNYLAAALKYYQEGEMDGPNRPQPLYGLFDIYRAEGDATDTVAVGEKILSNWPTDTRIQAALQAFLQSVSSTPAAAK
jgi:hypothetical protein